MLLLLAKELDFLLQIIEDDATSLRVLVQAWEPFCSCRNTKQRRLWSEISVKLF